ncbi:TetR/AcrR family transcriptional regulator [Trujillonella humicola]|uniref:TetR/AcrR family transcriptional regulator n=1 Tax=Trujillonella humicola TaxID=3383699 RepID=UPI003906CDA3
MVDARAARPRGSAREAVLLAVLEIAAERGIDAVTHRRVAERAGVSPGTTTHHFGSRDELLHSALRFYLERGDRWLLRIAERARSTTDDPVERLGRFVEEAIGREFTDERLVRAEHELLLYASGHDELAADVRAWDARWIAITAADLEAAGLPRPVEGARTILNVVRGFEMERLLDPALNSADVRRRIDWLLTPRESTG